MVGKIKSDPPMSLRDGMIFGVIWSVASVGWIAGIALIITWFKSGWDHALVWFGFILLMGAGLFGFILAFALVCEALNLTSKRSRRDSLNCFSWALVYNLVVGSVALLVALSFCSLEEDQRQEQIEVKEGTQPLTAPKLRPQ